MYFQDYLSYDLNNHLMIESESIFNIFKDFNTLENIIFLSFD